MKSVSYSLSDIILRQKQEFFEFQNKKYVTRFQEAELRKHLKSSLVKIILGPRRAGKSRLIQKVLEHENVAYLNFEEEQFRFLSGDAIIDSAHSVYRKADYWYLDEIQDFPQWEVFVNKLHRRGYNIVITGSNAKLLSSELATSLTGRHIAIELLPFSYAEFLLATNKNRSWESFRQYLEVGGFPEVVIGESIDRKAYLRTLFDSIVLKDIVKRKQIRNPSYLTNTISLLTNNVASPTSARALSKALNSTPSATTIEKYLNYIQEAYLFEIISPFAFKIKLRIQGERKPYAIDTGILDVMSTGNFPVSNKQLENVVFLELRRRGYSTQSTLFYYRLADGKEIDFLLRTGHQTTSLVQVCLDISSIDTREREVRALAKCVKEFPDASLTIVTANESGSIDLDRGKKIQLIPAFEFCK